MTDPFISSGEHETTDSSIREAEFIQRPPVHPKGRCALQSRGAETTFGGI
ncbi:MAG: hypothetical protein ACP5OU_03415 [Methanothrix sp.]